MSALDKSNQSIIKLERHDRLLRELVHDPYRSKTKLSDPTVCPDCGALYQKGRWTWLDVPAVADKKTCPACRRIREKVPAGLLTLTGRFIADHKDEITHLVQNLVKREMGEHPLKRIIAIEEDGNGLLITFTDPHLARSAGEAITHAYHGVLDFEYCKGEYLLRVNWSK